MIPGPEISILGAKWAFAFFFSRLVFCLLRMLGPMTAKATGLLVDRYDGLGTDSPTS
jgi:hypothetical protein